MRSCLNKVHTPLGGRKDRRTDGRNDGKPKTMSLRFSSKRRGTIVWFLNRSDTNRAVHAQKMARRWKFWIYKVEELFYPCSLICAFVFAYANC